MLARYRIFYEKKFDRWVEKNLPRKLKEVLDEKLKYLAENPKHPSLNTKPYSGVSPKTLKQLGMDGLYQFYVNMDYRVLLYVSDKKKAILIAFIGTHDDVRKFIRNS